jgi:hypothetical protein
MYMMNICLSEISKLPSKVRNNETRAVTTNAINNEG